MMPVGKLDLLLYLVLGKKTGIASEVEGSGYKGDFLFIESRGSYLRDFLGKGQEFRDTSSDFLIIDSEV